MKSMRRTGHESHAEENCDRAQWRSSNCPYSTKVVYGILARDIQAVILKSGCSWPTSQPRMSFWSLRIDFHLCILIPALFPDILFCLEWGAHGNAIVRGKYVLSFFSVFFHSQFWPQYKSGKLVYWVIIRFCVRFGINCTSRSGSFNFSFF